MKRELYGIAHGKIFFCEQLTNFSVKDNVVKMPYGGSKFRLRFFGTIMLTPCKANLAGYFCMFTALTTLPRVFIPLSHAGACLLAAINVNIAAWSPLGRDVCPRSSRCGTHSGCPLCYEMPCSSPFRQGGQGFGVSHFAPFHSAVPPCCRFPAGASARLLHEPWQGGKG